MESPVTSEKQTLHIHFNEIFEEFGTHTIRTKKKMQINGAVLGANIFIPDSFFINGNSLKSLKGKLLKATMTEKNIMRIEGVVIVEE